MCPSSPKGHDRRFCSCSVHWQSSCDGTGVCVAQPDVLALEIPRAFCHVLIRIVSCHGLDMSQPIAPTCDVVLELCQCMPGEMHHAHEFTMFFGLPQLCLESSKFNNFNWNPLPHCSVISSTHMVCDFLHVVGRHDRSATFCKEGVASRFFRL